MSRPKPAQSQITGVTPFGELHAARAIPAPNRGVPASGPITPVAGGFAQARQDSILEAADDERYVLAAEPEAVTEHVIDVLRARLVGHVVQVALRVWRFVIHGRRQHPVAYRQNAGDQLDRTGRRDQVA